MTIKQNMHEWLYVSTMYDYVLYRIDGAINITENKSKPLFLHVYPDYRTIVIRQFINTIN